MPLAISSTIPAAKSESRRSATTLSPTFGSAYTVAEINAYIAIRDQLLAEVLGCLQPARSPYEPQSLAETDAIRERQRCEIVRSRIAQLRNDAA